MRRHVRNIALGVVLGGIAAIISIVLVSNGSSPDGTDSHNLRSTVLPSPTSASETASASATVSGILFDPFQEGTPVPVNQPEHCGFSVDYVPARSVEELYDISFGAVHAKVSKIVDSFNSSGGHDASSQLLLARVYELDVIEYFKRPGPDRGFDTIEFVQVEGSLRRSDLSDEVLADFSLFESQQNCFSTLEIGQEYILFITPR